MVGAVGRPQVAPASWSGPGLDLLWRFKAGLDLGLKASPFLLEQCRETPPAFIDLVPNDLILRGDVLTREAPVQLRLRPVFETVQDRGTVRLGDSLAPPLPAIFVLSSQADV